MATISEDYVSFEIAKLLKEKGFDIICDKVYREYDSYLCPIEYCINLKGEGYYLAPTLQMVMKWLREVHNLFIQVEFDPPVFSADIFKINEVDEYGGAKHIPPTFANCKNYEQACEAAIKYYLENLENLG